MTTASALLVSLLALQAGPAPAPEDTLVRAGAYDLRFVVYRGEVPVTVLLEAGGGADLSRWSDVPALLAAETGATVVAYDRPGLGGSGPAPAGSTPDDELRALHAALDRLGVPPTTVEVAHSYGAMLALLNAGRFPDRVAALVLVDPMNPRFVRATGDFLYSTVPDVSRPANERERTIARQLETFPALVDRVEGLEPGLGQPMVVITAGEPWWGRGVDDAWRESHEALAAGERRRLVVAEGSDHDVPDERPDTIVEAVERVLATVSGTGR